MALLGYVTHLVTYLTSRFGGVVILIEIST
ncbi:hypothetical protein COLO4_37027 [Corchorus olitorius]|uniref:Uncharacterized protein n=1 Tax=Corchorus olitorius TaxID=93759 RepID=A0A1R3G3T8_9ROSI|nr:hypothetical protein COLO4_37027 [Corchorus olitorius]